MSLPAIENAVIHNRIHKEYPLRIELFNDKDHRLVVRNNLSIRDHSIKSTGIGLRSINSWYQLLNHEAPIIRQDADFFWVIIPLIPSGVVAETSHHTWPSNISL